MAGGPPKIDIIRVRCGLSKIDRIWQGVKKRPFFDPPEGGPPQTGGAPLLSKTDFFEKLPKEDALGRTYGQKMAFFGLFWGGSQKGLFWPFFDPF